MKSNSRRKYIVLYILVLLVCTSRALLSLLFGKELAYIVQFLFLCIGLISLLRLVSLRRSHSELLIYSTLMLIACVSVWITILTGGMEARSALIVTFVNLLNLSFLVLAIMLCGSGSRIVPEKEAGVVVLGIRILTIWVVLFGLLQYFGVIEFPGTANFLNEVRLSGSLGSKQHLSITLSILCLLNLEMLRVRFSMVDLVMFVLAVATLGMAYTRIGYFIFGLTLAFFLARLCMYRKRRSMQFLGAIALLAVVGLGALNILHGGNVVGNVLTRASEMNMESESNQIRLHQWINGLDLFSSGPIIVGGVTGYASQIPDVLFHVSSNHFESGQVEYLVNFGIIFWFIVAALYYRWMRSFSNDGVIKYLPATMWLALYIYMFNEIVPIYVMYPLVTMSNVIGSELRMKITGDGHGLREDAI